MAWERANPPPDVFLDYAGEDEALASARGRS